MCAPHPGPRAGSRRLHSRVPGGVSERSRKHDRKKGFSSHRSLLVSHFNSVAKSLQGSKVAHLEKDPTC